jgi:hypothetical protein
MGLWAKQSSIASTAPSITTTTRSPGNLYRLFDDAHKDRLTRRIAGALKDARKEVQLRQLCHFFRADVATTVRYLEPGAHMPLRAKVIACTMMWVAITASSILVISRGAPLFVPPIIIALGLFGTLCIVRQGRASSHPLR